MKTNLEDSQFIKLALQYNAINHEQLNECIQIQRKFMEQKQYFPISFILLKKQYISPSEITKIEFYSAAPQADPAQKDTQKSIASRYNMIAEIGKGGMGIVYKAIDTFLNREVAVKKLISTDQEDIERFLREARSMAKLDHSNIVKVYDVFQDENNIFFTMDFIKGQSLNHIIYKKGVSTKELLSLIIKIGDAVYYAHRQGIIHRDLKPENIMISEDGKPYVMDFGLARNIEEAKISTTGTIIGTPHYMSPEQAKGDSEIDERSDVYSLGVIIYQILTKRLPFEGKGLHEVLLQVYLNDPKPPSEVCKVSPELETICLKTLEKDPNNRYPNIPALMDDILRFLQGKNIQAQKPNQWQIFVRKIKRSNSLKIALVSTVTTFFILIFAIYSWSAWQTNTQIEDTVKKIDHMLANIEKYDNLVTEIDISKELSPEIRRKIEIFLSEYMSIRTLLDQSIAISPQHPRILEYTFNIEKEMGLLALLARNYILSELCFQRCLKIKNNEQTYKLLVMLEKQKEAIKTKQIQYLHFIMDNIKKKPPAGMLDEYITSIIKMHGEHIVKELLLYVKDSDTILQQQVAVEAIGKIGDKSTKLEGKDVVEWLILLSEEKKIVQDEALAEAFVWAFGRLSDARLHRWAYFIRHHFGESHPFHWRTEIPYSWIPIDKNSILEEKPQEKYTLDDFRELYANASQKVDKKDYLGAIKDFSTILLKFQDVGLYTQRGSVYEQIGNFEEAMNDYNKGLELAKRQNEREVEANIYDHRAILSLKIKNPTQALDDWENAIRINPRPEHYCNRGFFYANNNQTYLALNDYEAALKINPNHFATLSNRSYLYLSTKEWQKAIIDLQRALKLNPNSDTLYVNLGYVYGHLDNQELAMANYIKALKINPRITAAYVNVGYIYHAQKNMKKALKYYNDGIAIDDKYPLLYENRGRLYFDLEMWQKAIHDYTTAINLLSEQPKSYKNRGISFKKLGQHDKAISDWKKYLQIAKDEDEKEKQEVIGYLKNEK